MKKTAIWVLRHIIITVGFIWSTGIINAIVSISTTKNIGLTHTFTEKELSALEMTPKSVFNYGDSLIKERTLHISHTGVYEPFLYFHDLKQYEMFKYKYSDSLNKTPEGRMIILTCLEGMSMRGINRLVNLRDDNWRKLDMKELNRTSSSGLFKMNTDEARNFWFPNEAKKVSDKKYSLGSLLRDAFFSTANWILCVYLRGFVFAFLLFLIWKFNLKRELRESTVYGAPLSFLFSVLVWPIILWIDIKNRAKEALMRAEVISRRSNLLSLLSKHEQQIVEFGKKMSFSEFRMQLHAMGIRRKHSLAKAFLVMVVMTLFPRFSIGEQHLMCTAITIVCTEEVARSDASHIERHFFCYEIDIGQLSPLLQHPVIWIKEKKRKLFSFITIFYKNEFFPDIGKIPKLKHQSDFKLMYNF